MLALIDDGVTPSEIEQVIDWLLSENRYREHEGKYPFVVQNPTELRAKWARIYGAAAKDRQWCLSIEEPTNYIRIRNQRRYVEHLFAVPFVGEEEGEVDEDNVHLARLLDPRNKVPPHIAFCFCVERMFPEGIVLAKDFVAVAGVGESLAIYFRVFPEFTRSRLDELRLMANMPRDCGAKDAPTPDSSDECADMRAEEGR